MKKPIRKKNVLLSIMLIFQTLLIPSIALPAQELFCDLIDNPIADYKLDRFFDSNSSNNKIFIYAEKEKESAGYIAIIAQNKHFDYSYKTPATQKNAWLGIFLFDSKTKEYLMTLDMMDINISFCHCIAEIGQNYLIFTADRGDITNGSIGWKYFFDLKNKKVIKKVADSLSYIDSFNLHNGILSFLGSYNNKKIMITVNPEKKKREERYQLSEKVYTEKTKALPFDISTYKIPRPTRDVYEKFRDDSYPSEDHYVETPVIGATFVAEDKVWFGTTFYGGEGHDSVGGFGYIDIKTKKMEFNHYKEIADYSITAIYVENDNVWLGLAINYTYGPSSQGFAMYNSKDGSINVYKIPPEHEPNEIIPNYLIDDIVKVGDYVYLLIKNKVFVYTDGKFPYILTITMDINGNPALEFFEDMNDFDEIKWGI